MNGLDILGLGDVGSVAKAGSLANKARLAKMAKGEKVFAKTVGNETFLPNYSDNLVIQAAQRLAEINPVQKVVEYADNSPLTRPFMKGAASFTGAGSDSRFLGKNVSEQIRLKELKKKSDLETRQNIYNRDKEIEEKFGDISDEDGVKIVQEIEGGKDTSSPSPVPKNSPLNSLEEVKTRIEELNKAILNRDLSEAERADIIRRRNKLQKFLDDQKFREAEKQAQPAEKTTKINPQVSKAIQQAKDNKPKSVIEEAIEKVNEQEPLPQPVEPTVPKETTVPKEPAASKEPSLQDLKNELAFVNKQLARGNKAERAKVLRKEQADLKTQIANWDKNHNKSYNLADDSEKSFVDNFMDSYKKDDENYKKLKESNFEGKGEEQYYKERAEQIGHNKVGDIDDYQKAEEQMAMLKKIRSTDDFDNIDLTELAKDKHFQDEDLVDLFNAKTDKTTILHNEDNFRDRGLGSHEKSTQKTELFKQNFTRIKGKNELKRGNLVGSYVHENTHKALHGDNAFREKIVKKYNAEHQDNIATINKDGMIIDKDGFLANERAWQYRAIKKLLENSPEERKVALSETRKIFEEKGNVKGLKIIDEFSPYVNAKTAEEIKDAKNAFYEKYKMHPEEEICNGMATKMKESYNAFKESLINSRKELENDILERKIQTRNGTKQGVGLQENARNLQETREVLHEGGTGRNQEPSRRVLGKRTNRNSKDELVSEWLTSESDIQGKFYNLEEPSDIKTKSAKQSFKDFLKENSDFYKKNGLLKEEQEQTNILNTYVSYKTGKTKVSDITDAERQQALVESRKINFKMLIASILITAGTILIVI